MTSFNVAENPMFPTDEKDSQSFENCCEQTATNAKTESQLDLVLDHADPVKNFAHAFYGRFKFILPATTVISFVFCGQIFIANIFLNQESHQNFIFGGLQTKMPFLNGMVFVIVRIREFRVFFFSSVARPLRWQLIC